MKNIDGFSYLYQESYSLKNLNTWKVGGDARYYSEPEHIKEVIQLQKFVNNRNIKKFVLGKGSNVLIDDDGYEGLVMNLTKGFTKFKVIEEEYIEVQSGVSLPKLAIQLSRQNIKGYDFLTGIPGTIGGAIVMNAGCIGKEIKDYLISVTFIDEASNLIEKNINEIDMNFRSSEFLGGDCIIVSCKLRYKRGESKEECIEKTKRAISIRKSKFPMNVATAGSTFKSHPNGPFPGKLIEEAGLKGYSIGGAMISKNHGNWIINTGNATSKDIKELIILAQKKVYEATNVYLDTEVIILS